MSRLERVGFFLKSH